MKMVHLTIVKLLVEYGIDRINRVAVNQVGEIAVVGRYMSSDMYLNEDKEDLSSTITHAKKNGV